MSEAIGVSPSVLPEPALIEALGSQVAPADRLILLAQLRRRAEDNRAALNQQTIEFDKMYEEAAQRFQDARGLVQLAEAVQNSERGAAKQLDPWIAALHQTLARHSDGQSQDARQYLQELLNNAVACLALYRNVRQRLLKLANERRSASGEVLQARPVAGEVDYPELIRDTIARYPKILSALAK